MQKSSKIALLTTSLSVYENLQNFSPAAGIKLTKCLYTPASKSLTENFKLTTMVWYGGWRRAVSKLYVVPPTCFQIWGSYKQLLWCLDSWSEESSIMRAYLYCFPGNRPRSAIDWSSTNVSDPTFAAAQPGHAETLTAQTQSLAARRRVA